MDWGNLRTRGILFVVVGVPNLIFDIIFISKKGFQFWLSGISLSAFIIYGIYLILANNKKA